MARSRAFRRHHHERMIEKVRGFVCIKSLGRFLSKKEIENKVRHMAETRSPCSCHMCGNARKLWKQKSFKEKRFDISSKEFLELNEY